MDIQASEKRKFLERTREYVLYDILKQEDIDKIKSIYVRSHCCSRSAEQWRKSACP